MNATTKINLMLELFSKQAVHVALLNQVAVPVTSSSKATFKTLRASGLIASVTLCYHNPETDGWVQSAFYILVPQD